MIQLERDTSKKMIDSIKDVLGHADYTMPVGEYIGEIDEKIRKVIQESGLKDTETLERDYKVFRRQLLGAIRSGEVNSFSDVSSFLVQFGLGNLPENLEKQDVIIADLDEDFWNQSSVGKPKEGVIYRGGTARKILREFLNLSVNPADENTDIDVFLSPELDINAVRGELGCDAEGITQLDAISDSALVSKCKLVDMGMNQVLVSEDKIYYTQKSEQAMKTGVSEMLEEPDNLFGVKQYKDSLGRVIFTNQKLYRLISMLVRGKIEKVSIRQDNISSENSDAIGGMQKYLIIVLKKIISEASGDIERLGEMMFRYADLLKQMGYISQHEEVFDFLGDTHFNGPVKVHDTYLQKDFDDGGKRDMIWRLDKLTRVLVRKIIPDTLQDFKYDPRNGVVNLGINYSGYDDFKNIFDEAWSDFYERVQTQDQEK